MAGDLLALMWVPFLMCLVLTGIHAYLGFHVIAREVVFVDIALAQIAALGATAAFLFGFDLASWPSYCFRARLHRARRPRPRADAQPRAPRLAGGDHRRRVRRLLRGGRAPRRPLAPRRRASARHARRQHPERERQPRSRRSPCSTRRSASFTGACRRPSSSSRPIPTRAYREGWRVRGWDFLFYASFGVVVTSSVRIAGVLLVFSYLIVPALAGILLGGQHPDAAPDRLGLRHARERARDARLRLARSADGRDGGLRVRPHPARAGDHRHAHGPARASERRRARAARGDAERAGEAPSPRPAGPGVSLRRLRAGIAAVGQAPRGGDVLPALRVLPARGGRPRGGREPRAARGRAP